MAGPKVGGDRGQEENLKGKRRGALSESGTRRIHGNQNIHSSKFRTMTTPPLTQVSTIESTAAPLKESPWDPRIWTVRS